MPDAVLLVDAHVAHLDRQEVLEGRLPDVARVDVLIDAERARLHAAVAHHVRAGTLDGSEVEAQVLVAQEAAPPGRGGFLQLLEGARFRHARENDRQPPLVALVELDHRELRLLRVIADLRGLHDRLRGEALDRVRRDQPVDGALRGTLRDQRTHHEPAVVVQAAAVDQLERAAGRVLDRHALAVGLGRDHEPPAAGHGRDRVIAIRVEGAGTVRLPREQAARALGRPGPAEQDPGEQLEVEADLADPRVRQRRIEVDHDAHGLALGAHADGVGEAQVRVLDGVEALAVLRIVRVLHPYADLAARAVDHALAHHLRHRLPLARRAVEAQVAVGRHALAVLDDADAPLVALGVVVVRQHHVETGPLEVLELVQAQGGRRGRSSGGGDRRGGRGQGKQPGQEQQVSRVHEASRKEGPSGAGSSVRR